MASRDYKGLLLQGRYTRDLTEYHLSVPRRVSATGQLISFHLPEFFEHDPSEGRAKRDDARTEEELHYNVVFDGEDHYVLLRPNHGFVSGDLVVERFGRDLAKRDIRRPSRRMCHFTGHVRGNRRQKVALSLCDGMAGYLMTDSGRYFIEPMAEHQPNENGEHVHVVYKREIPSKFKSQCEVNQNWPAVWEERLREKYQADPASINKSYTASRMRFLEILVVADKRFLDYHKLIDFEQYIMTVMNMVSSFYHDASAGNAMDIELVRIIYLDKDEKQFDVLFNAHAENTLQNFCKWQNTINPKDDGNPTHHDIAVLLTRYDICADNMQECNVLGLAFMTSACTDDKNCAITEDNGLELGVTVTHEIGHIMGCSHDEPENSGCEPEDPEGFNYVMSPYTSVATKSWSKCSKAFLTQLFEKGLGECLNDKAVEPALMQGNILPGVVYDAEMQCNFLYPGSKFCKMPGETFCEKLWCRVKPTRCSSKGEPPVDGTLCAENKKKCVEIGQRPEAVNGGWGPYGEWSECSRTCGGGVTYQERDCNNPIPKNGGKYCLGERKKYKLCNIQPCAANASSFRQVQCEKFNHELIEGNRYKWKAYFYDKFPCGLYCVNEENVFMQLSPQAKDGTLCKKGTKNRCINGVCRTVGCDWIIDSQAVEDICGICNGDGSDCETITHVFRDPQTEYKYVKVHDVPIGAANLEFIELKSSTNTIAVSSPDESVWYLNGKMIEKPSGNFDFGNCTGVYNHPEPDRETLYIKGPTTKPLTLHVAFFELKNVGYKYTYSIPKERSVEIDPARYYWDILQYDKCNANCGGGFALARPECVELEGGRVSDSFCSGKIKPEPLIMRCNVQPCAIKWRVGPWSVCNGRLFTANFKSRTVECIREAPRPGQDGMLVEDDLCPGPKPATRQLCCSHRSGRKTRAVSGLQGKLSLLWYEINKDWINNNNKYFPMRDGNPLFKRDLKKDSCSHSKREANTLHSNLTRTVDYVTDIVPTERILLFEVPIKETEEDVDLSDDAYETGGDRVADMLDFCHMQNFTGTEAVERLKELQQVQDATEVNEEQ